MANFRVLEHLDHRCEFSHRLKMVRYKLILSETNQFVMSAKIYFLNRNVKTTDQKEEYEVPGSNCLRYATCLDMSSKVGSLLALASLIIAKIHIVKGPKWKI